MSEHDVLKKNRNFYIGVGGTVLEGLLSGSLFMLLYSVMQFLWSGQFDMNRALILTGVIAVIFLLRILIYSYGYTKAQIGGAEVSKNIRLFMGDHLKRIPLSRFTQGQTGDYINTITSDVNNYEKILTHKIGDLAKSFALSLMLIIFVMTIYVPAGIILLIADLLLIPGLWLSFRMVRKYGKEKNDICAENVSSIVEYVSGIQTFRAYGVCGLKNKTVIGAMREFCRISFVYEAKVLPIGAGFGILSWLSCPLVIWTAYAPWAAGTLDTVSYLLICMLPLFCAKLANSIFVDLTSYKNLMISKNKILGVMNEPEETGSMGPLQTATHEITFDSVDFSYVPGEPVLKHATFTVPDQKLTAIVGDSGSGKSTTLAAMLDEINHTRKNHIVTLEDPIEYVYTPDLCVINQREVGKDTASFSEGLRASLREDPDVILIGEMRDKDTIETAITAAETGHLVFGTLHTGSASDAIDRMVQVFPEGMQNQIRLQLSMTLMAVISQQLVKKKTGGRVLASEVMVVTDGIRNMIRGGNTPQIANAIATSAAIGGQTMDQSLVSLVRSRQIDKSVAVEYSHDQAYVKKNA